MIEGRGQSTTRLNQTQAVTRVALGWSPACRLAEVRRPCLISILLLAIGTVGLVADRFIGHDAILEDDGTRSIGGNGPRTHPRGMPLVY